MPRPLKTPPLKFRSYVPRWFGKRLYLRVTVFDERPAMLAAVKKAWGSHADEVAVTLVEGAPDRGRIGDMFLTFRAARPGVLAHEAGHAAWRAALFLGIGIGPDDETEEKVMQLQEKFVDDIWNRIQKSRVA